MRIGIRGKLFVASLGLVLAVILSVGIYLEHALTGWLELRIAAELKGHAAIGRALIAAEPGGLTIERMDLLADRLGGGSGTRITVIARDGRVLGDSQLDGAQILRVENHGGRPEVKQALRAELGQSKRFSTTVSTPMLYVALPFSKGSEGSGVVRAAMPMEEVAQVMEHLRWVLFLAGLLAVAAAISASGLSAQLTTRPLRRVVDHARNLSLRFQGGRSAPPPIDEIDVLAGSLNLLAVELERTVNALDGERSRLLAVLEGMEEGVVALDDRSCVTLMNWSVLRLLNLPHPLPGRPVEKVLPGTALAELRAPDNPHSPPAAEFQQAAPPHHHLLVVMTPLARKAGHVLVIRDVTEVRRLERMRRDFVANVSHELRTPVSVIQANAQTLLDGAMEDARYGRILATAMDRNATRLSRIIADLLELSRLESGKAGLVLQPVTLAPVVQQVVESTRLLAEAKQTTVEVSIPAALQVLAEEEGLNRVLTNLLENAIRHTPSGSSVECRAVEMGEEACIEVRDDGPGIPVAHRERIFERFYRVDSGRTRKMGGTGLGLSIVKHLMDNMQGSISMSPLQPRGSLFQARFRKPPEQSSQGLDGAIS